MWFNQPFRLKDLRIDQRMMATGLVKSTGTSWEIVHPDANRQSRTGEVPDSLKPLPVYPLTEGLTQPVMRKCFAKVSSVLSRWSKMFCPRQFALQLDVPSIHDALTQLHWPDTLEEANARDDGLSCKSCCCCNGCRNANASAARRRQGSGLEHSTKIHARNSIDWATF